MAAPEMPFGCFAVCHAACSSSSFLSAASVSFAPLHSTAPLFASLHHVRSHLFCFKGMACMFHHTNQNTSCSLIPFRKLMLQYSLGFISLVRRFFISVVLNPPAAYYFCRRSPHYGCVHLATAICLCRTSISQSIVKVLLHSSTASVP